ncbi:MAG: tyrosine/phenylalanine carboxypeptidase domain-containing protein [Acidobacteriota bacterium]
MKTIENAEVIRESLIRTLQERLRENKRIRRSFPEGGRLHIDRQLPFLCVYRIPTTRPDFQTGRLIIGQASYLLASGAKHQRQSVSSLVRMIVQTLSREFGTFLITELWSGPAEHVESANPAVPQPPGFRLVIPRSDVSQSIVDSYRLFLERIRIRRMPAMVDVVRSGRVAPAHCTPILTPAERREFNCHVIGLEVRPIYFNSETGEEFPLIRRTLQRELTRSLQQIFFSYTRSQTTQKPLHYLALGRRAVVKAVWDADKKLDEISESFDFLLQATPVNIESAWLKFRRRKFQRTPDFLYRPQPVDPAQLKQKLWKIPIYRIEDPTLAYLFREKQDELDTQLSMMSHLGTKNFFYGSMQLYGQVSASLARVALQILETIPSRSKQTNGRLVTLDEFVSCARDEMDYYRRIYPAMNCTVEVRNDITGLMVSRGNLLVSRTVNIPAARVDALLQHEIGTHVLTYVNGLAQPLHQLHEGLCGYEELQEGIAVFSEYLVNGLSRPRLRLLAARVIAAQRLIEGASFIDTFRELNGTWGFEQRLAFIITARIYRGGGLTKDMVYLRGLLNLLSFLGSGGSLESLLVGKIGADHVQVIRELQYRKLMNPVPLRPRYLESPEVCARLARAKKELTINELIERK